MSIPESSEDRDHQAELQDRKRMMSAGNAVSWVIGPTSATVEAEKEVAASGEEAVATDAEVAQEIATGHHQEDMHLAGAAAATPEICIDAKEEMEATDQEVQ